MKDAELPSLEAQLLREALGILRRLSPAELWSAVLEPLFTAQGWEPAELGRDRRLTAKAHGELWVLRIRVDALPEPVTSETVLDHLEREARAALCRRYGEDDRIPLLRYRWVLALILPEEVRREVRQRLDKDFGGRVVVWDLEALYRELVEQGQMRTIVPLQIIHAKHQAAQHHGKKEGVFAANWSYRALRLYLRQGPLAAERAIDCLDEGLSALKEDRYRAIYYHRVLAKVLEMWRFLLRSEPGMMGPGWQRSLSSPETVELLQKENPAIPCIDWLLQDFEAVFRQLERIDEYYVAGPSGYSTLEFCRLLLRFGFSPAEPRIRSRLGLALRELAEEDGESVDGKCSLCTGSLVSCFSLARNPEAAKKAVEWLKGLSEQRYCHLRPRYLIVKEYQYALHYAAAVLQGLLDFHSEDGLGPLQEILKPFFKSDDREGHGLYHQWLLYRNHDIFEIYRQILSTFLRLFLMGHPLSVERTDFLRTAVADLITALEHDSGRSTDREVQPPSLLYAGRTNLSSFALGCLLDVPGAASLGREVVQTLHYRAQTAARYEDDQLWDSSVDRTAMFLRGYLDYWETVLCLAEQGGSVTDFLPVDLGTGD